VAESNLRDELLQLPGVAEAEVDESGDSASGVRVRLAPDADARLVGAEVQRVLAAHGMRSRVTGADEKTEPEESSGDAAPVPPPAIEAPAPQEIIAAMPPPIAAVSAPSTPPSVATIEPPREAPPSAAVDAGLASLRVEESSEGLAVTAVFTDGRTLTQRSGPSEEGMYEAVVSAVGALADGHPPALVSVDGTVAGGSEVMTVVLERADGTRAAGAAVVKASKAFAVARATWSALRGG